MALPRDIGIGKDDFQKSMIYSEVDSLARYILSILLMKPGNLPSMPNIGVDLPNYVKNHMGATLDTNTIKGLIATNCEDLLPYITNEDVFVGVVYDKKKEKEFLIISVPLTYNDDSARVNANYAFYRDELNQLKFNFIVTQN